MLMIIPQINLLFCCHKIYVLHSVLNNNRSNKTSKSLLHTDSRHSFYHRTSKLENQRQIPRILDMILQGPLY